MSEDGIDAAAEQRADADVVRFERTGKDQRSVRPAPGNRAARAERHEKKECEKERSAAHPASVPLRRSRRASLRAAGSAANQVVEVEGRKAARLLGQSGESR